MKRTAAVLLAVMMTSAFVADADAASHRHRALRHHVVHSYSHRGGFGRFDPDNIGVYGGRDFGFFEGPNYETTYDYGLRR